MGSASTLLHLFNCHIYGATKYTTDLVSVQHFASYVPQVLNYYSDHMTFWQRMYNSFTYWFEELALPIYYMPTQQKMVEENFPNAKNWSSLAEIKQNVSTVLLNTHVTYGTACSYPLNMIEAGGIRIKKNVTPLPLEIQTFSYEAKYGAIYISLGSNVLLTKIPAHQRDAILNGFFGYRNTHILLKSDGNVRIPFHKKLDIPIQP